MDGEGGPRSGELLPAFWGEVDADHEDERRGEGRALSRAIAEAATQAAEFLASNELGPANFEVTRIEVRVEPNPGPTAYRVIIRPTG